MPNPATEVINAVTDLLYQEQVELDGEARGALLDAIAQAQYFEDEFVD